MLQYIRAFADSRIPSDRGASAVEYGILVAAIAAVIVAIVFVIGTQVKQGFSTTCTGLKAAGGAAGSASC